MPWNSTAPLGTVSVKANRSILQDNTTYTETTMGNSVVGTNTVTTRDHFWNVGSDEDGRHRFIQSPAFTVGGIAADPVVGTGMGGVQYLKTTSGRVEGFYRNANGIYQHIPSFKSGSVFLESKITFEKVADIPANVYGEILMHRTSQGRFNTVTGFFRSDATKVYAWSVLNIAYEETTPSSGLEFANGSVATNLELKARVSKSDINKTWYYKITYRAL